MAFYDVDIGVVLNFPIIINGLRKDLTAPAPTSIQLLLPVEAQAGPFTLTVSADPTVATMTVQAGNFPIPGLFTAVVKLVYSPTQVYHSKAIQLRVKTLYE